MIIKTLIIGLFTVLLSPQLFAKNLAQVMPFGTFHFANPGLDKVKTNVINVLTEENQRYLEALSKRIANGFKPTQVLLECDKKNNVTLNENFNKYLVGDFSLPVNETYQLGFRIARLAGLDQVICYDEREVHWQPGALFEEVPKSNPALQKEMDALIATFTKQMNDMHQNNSLAEILRANNDQRKDAENRAFYILTNEVGAYGSYSGADASASWWQRNFRMYANIQHAAQHGERVLVIGGQGHTSILKGFVSDDAKRELVSPVPYL